MRALHLHGPVLAILGLIMLIGMGCGPNDGGALATLEDIEQAFLLAQDNDEIVIAAGHYDLTRSLILDGLSNVTVRGAGMNETVFSFAGQTQGAEGIRVANSTNITVEGLTLLDVKGDALKFHEVDGIVVRHLKTDWTGDPKPTNGAYGVYPVLSTNIVIEDCEARGASDTGIYVGQSRDVVVRRVKAYENVVGVESENSTNVRIYDNELYNNAAGIAIFDLPGLEMFSEGNVKVYNNHIYDNNLWNFAPEGAIVAAVPSGTGLMVMATGGVEVYNNRLVDNSTAGIILTSFMGGESGSEEAEAEAPAMEREELSAQRLTEDFQKDKAYNPWIRDVNVHDNSIERDPSLPLPSDERSQAHFLVNTMRQLFGEGGAGIVFDGNRNPAYINEDGAFKDPYRICLDNNTEVPFVDLDAGNEGQNLSMDITPFHCVAAGS